MVKVMCVDDVFEIFIFSLYPGTCIFWLNFLCSKGVAIYDVFLTRYFGKTPSKVPRSHMCMYVHIIYSTDLKKFNLGPSCT